MSKQGNDLADRKNDLDWTIRRHSPNPVIARVRRRLRDYQGVGSKELATPHESLRFSPAPCESTGYKARGGLALILAQKSYEQHLSGKGAGNLLRVRGLGKSTPVASAVCYNRARLLVAGTRKATRYQGNWGNPFLAWRNEPGYGHKSLDDDLRRSEIGNPHGNILRALRKAYGWPSETERQSLDYEGVSIPSLVKIQSTPRSKDVDIVTPTDYALLYYTNSKHHFSKTTRYLSKSDMKQEINAIWPSEGSNTLCKKPTISAIVTHFQKESHPKPPKCCCRQERSGLCQVNGPKMSTTSGSLSSSRIHAL